MTSTASVPLAIAAAVAALTTGCAADPQAGASEPVAPPEYRTGSNISTRHLRPITDEERERAQSDVEELRRNAGKPGM